MGLQEAIKTQFNRNPSQPALEIGESGTHLPPVINVSSIGGDEATNIEVVKSDDTGETSGVLP